jgi:hypothetical protein
LGEISEVDTGRPRAHVPPVVPLTTEILQTNEAMTIPYTLHGLCRSTTGALPSSTGCRIQLLACLGLEPKPLQGSLDLGEMP